MADSRKDSAEPLALPGEQKVSQKKRMMPSKKEKQDISIMETNNSCIVSKRSVERIYYQDDHGFLRYFVKKFQRRSPLINRGYWLRMRAIEHVVRAFLDKNQGKKCTIINLGCGYDPLPFKFLSRDEALCKGATFVDVDYRQLMLKKCEIIRATPELSTTIKLDSGSSGAGDVLIDCSCYKATACDLEDLAALNKVLKETLNLGQDAVLFLAEVSITYMDALKAEKLIEWASTFKEAQFAVLEQYLPDGEDHPFAVTMLNHFRKLNSPLKTAIRYPSAADQKQRFARGHWTSIDFRSLWSLWSDNTFISPRTRKALDEIEPFDEWEEFALFCSHYFLIIARNTGPSDVHYERRKLQDESDVESNEQDSSPKVTIKRWPLESQPRRFAASFTSGCNMWSAGGHGIQNRLEDAELILSTSGLALSYKPSAVSMPRLPTQLLCHTMTRLDGDEVLIVGGRASPASPSKACYIKSGASWVPAQDLPFPLFRHSAVKVKLRDHSGAGAETGVLVFGGRSGPSDINGDWLLWTKGQGWKVLEVIHSAPQARFGASLVVTDYSEGVWPQHDRTSSVCSGLLTGGIGNDGIVLQEIWRWSLNLGRQGQPYLGCAQTSLKPHDLRISAQFGRFGASLVKVGQYCVLVGGVTGENVLPHEMEVLVFDLNFRPGWTGDNITFERHKRPLLVGCNIEVSADHTIVIAFGGAVCFSFGTCWNESIWTLRLDEHPSTAWAVIPQTENSVSSTRDSTRSNLLTQPTSGQETEATERTGVYIDASSSPIDFASILHQNTPAVLQGVDLGLCTQKWTSTYLKDQIGAERQVVIHSSPSATMNFLNKDFTYTTITLRDFLSRASSGEHVYLRALSSSNPASQATKLSEDFPAIANDFQLPPELAYVFENMHSSPLRLSGPVTMWLHFDVMANVYCQIRGHKRLVLFPPSDVNHLDFPAGASSSRLNIFDTDGDAHYPNGTHPIVFDVKPGDVLFIPPLWPHTTKPIVAEGEANGGLNVAVNVFFKSMKAGYAAGKDVYGNRDLAAYENGRRDVARVAKAFQGLPDDARRFYLARLAKELAELAEA